MPDAARLASHLTFLMHPAAGVGPYTRATKQLEKDIQGEMKKISELIGAPRRRSVLRAA